MECKCVVAGSYEEALEKLNKGEFYTPKTKADYEIRINGKTVTVENKNGETWTGDMYGNDLLSCFEDALQWLNYEERKLTEDERALLETMKRLGYSDVYVDFTDDRELDLEFRREESHHTTINGLYNMFLWLEDGFIYSIDELLSEH